MNFLLKDLSVKQRCAFIGLALGLCAGEIPSREQVQSIDDGLQDLEEEVGVTKRDIQLFMDKIGTFGVLGYSIDILKTVENKKNIGIVYPNLYSIVAALKSTNCLTKLNNIYKDNFGFSDEDIDILWDLYEIKDFRNPLYSQGYMDLQNPYYGTYGANWRSDLNGFQNYRVDPIKAMEPEQISFGKKCLLYIITAILGFFVFCIIASIFSAIGSLFD